MKSYLNELDSVKQAREKCQEQKKQTTKTTTTRKKQKKNSKKTFSGDDVKLKGTRKVGGAGKKEKEGRGLGLGLTARPLPSFPRFIFVFAFSQFSRPDYLGAWNRLYGALIIYLIKLL